MKNYSSIAMNYVANDAYARGLRPTIAHHYDTEEVPLFLNDLTQYLSSCTWSAKWMPCISSRICGCILGSTFWVEDTMLWK